MAADLRLPSWERIVANLAAKQRLGGNPSEFAHPFADPALDAAERQALRAADQRSRMWLLGLFPILLAVLASRMSRRSVERMMDDAGPDAAEPLDVTIQVAWAIGEARAQSPPARPMTPGRIEPGARVPLDIPEPMFPESPPPTPPIQPPPLAPDGAPEGMPRFPASVSPRGAAQAEGWARMSAALKMREWAAGMREDVRWQTADAVRQGVGPEELARRLRERWAQHGQNFHLIAITELADAFSSGMLWSLDVGSYVTVPPIGDARVCPECRELLESRVFEVRHSAPRNPSRFDLETTVWPGKSNVGRDKADWVPCITLHPRCRHLFLPFSPRPMPRAKEDAPHHATPAYPR